MLTWKTLFIRERLMMPILGLNASVLVGLQHYENVFDGSKI